MEKAQRTKRLILAAIVLGFAASVAALSTETAGAQLCSILRSRLSQRLGFQVAIGSCHIQPLSFSVRFEDIAFPQKGAAGARAPTFTADTLRMSLRGIFPGHVSLHDMTVHRPKLQLALGGTGGQAPAAAPKACPLEALKSIRVNALTLTQGDVRLRLPGERPLESASAHSPEWT